MSGEHDARPGPHRLRQSCDRVVHVRGVGGDPQGMIEPASGERDLDVAAFASQLRPGSGDVLAILLAARIGVLRRGDEPDRAPRALVMHLAERVGQQRMPVAHPDVYRHWVPDSREPVLETLRLTPRHLGDR